MSVPEPPSDPGIDAGTFVSVFRSHAAGVTVITTDPGTGPVGLTATSVSSVSVDPPLLVFSVGRQGSRYPAFARASTVAVNFLGADQAALAEHFAARGTDWFSTVAWSRAADGTPTLDDAPSVVIGPIEARHVAGDHDLLVIRVATAEQRRNYRPLVYHHRRYRGTLDVSGD